MVVLPTGHIHCAGGADGIEAEVPALSLHTACTFNATHKAITLLNGEDMLTAAQGDVCASYNRMHNIM